MVLIVNIKQKAQINRVISLFFNDFTEGGVLIITDDEVLQLHRRFVEY